MHKGKKSFYCEIFRNVLGYRIPAVASAQDPGGLSLTVRPSFIWTWRRGCGLKSSAVCSSQGEEIVDLYISPVQYHQPSLTGQVSSLTLCVLTLEILQIRELLKRESSRVSWWWPALLLEDQAPPAGQLSETMCSPSIAPPAGLISHLPTIWSIKKNIFYILTQLLICVPPPLALLLQ